MSKRAMRMSPQQFKLYNLADFLGVLLLSGGTIRSGKSIAGIFGEL